MKHSIIFKVLIFIIITTLISCTCDDDIVIVENPVEGCTDPLSITYNVNAENDNGSCEYSNLTFYAKYSFFQNVPIVKIDIDINGEIIGSINDGFVWPNGPGNCNANGTVAHQFVNSDKVDWNALIYLSNGVNVSSSGEIEPNRFSDCIKINVTR